MNTPRRFPRSSEIFKERLQICRCIAFPQKRDLTESNSVASDRAKSRSRRAKLNEAVLQVEIASILRSKTGFECCAALCGIIPSAETRFQFEIRTDSAYVTGKTRAKYGILVLCSLWYTTEDGPRLRDFVSAPARSPEIISASRTPLAPVSARAGRGPRFPLRQKILVRRTRFRFVRIERVRPRQPELRVRHKDARWKCIL